MKKKTSSISLSILGQTGIATGHITAAPLMIQAENSFYIPHKNTWDVSLSDPAILNNSAVDEIIATITYREAEIVDLIHHWRLMLRKEYKHIPVLVRQ